MAFTFGCRDVPTIPGERTSNAIGIGNGGALPAFPELIDNLPEYRFDEFDSQTESSDEDLAIEVERAGGYAIIGLKSPAAPRSSIARVRAAMTRTEALAARNALRASGVEPVASFRFSSAVVARIRPSDVRTIRALPMVDYVEADGVGRVELSTAGFAAPGQDTTWGVLRIRAPEVWNGSLGPATRGQNAHVTIIDSGLDQVHLLTGDGPVPVTHCLWHSSTVDPEQGAHCYANSGSHGAFMGGVIAAADNLDGVIGVAPSLTGFNSLKICKGDTACTPAALAHAIEWAVMYGSTRHIVNISMGWCKGNSTVRSALQAAQSAGILVIAAAGNGWSNVNSCEAGGTLGNVEVKYPARYPEVMAVSGFNLDNSFVLPPELGSSPPNPCDPSIEECSPVNPGEELGCNMGSRYGPEVEISAPFFATSLRRDGMYGSDCGTSAAAAFVSGAAALVWSRNPTLTASQVRQRLKSYAVYSSSQHPYQFGSGRLDVAAATYVAPPPPPPLSVSILGIDTIVAPGNYTWNASVSGGTGSYAYAWSWAPSGSVFTSLGTASSAQMYVDENTVLEFWLRLDVTSGTLSATEMIHVVNQINYNPCAPYVCIVAPRNGQPK